MIRVAQRWSSIIVAAVVLIALAAGAACLPTRRNRKERFHDAFTYQQVTSKRQRAALSPHQASRVLIFL
jgi:hypothetical protein